MTRLDVERTELRSFTCGVHFEATRNLALLGAIESTLSWLESLTTRLLADTNFADKANEGLASFADVIDPDGTIQNALESAQSDVDELYQLLVEKRQHGRSRGRACRRGR